MIPLEGGPCVLSLMLNPPNPTPLVSPSHQTQELLLKLCTLSPASLSLWVASLFPAFPDQQQIVLQQEDAMVRLNMVRDLLSQVVKFYQAEWAVRSAFGAPEGRAGSRSGLVGPQWDVDEEDDALGGGDSSSDED